ncbi:sugar O-acetyltransferase [Massilia sp. TWR1-2-2]|uniref:sugar O-acetyltransferase n=1 Tax=Massilia sp. TWR1-2-2 TaxID=2804584 RepID=UPI003CFB16C1
MMIAMTLSEKQKMLAGELYRVTDPELQADQAAARAWMDQYNDRQDVPAEYARALLLARLAAVGEGAIIRPPFHVDYGFNITVGRGVFINFNCVILDVAPVVIGDFTQIGPGVQILAADHPRNPVERAQGAEFGRPILIGQNVWIGGGALILPGVTIGDNALVGAGSVVTRDVPEGVTVVGNPARALPES